MNWGNTEALKATCSDQNLASINLFKVFSMERNLNRNIWSTVENPIEFYKQVNTEVFFANATK